MNVVLLKSICLVVLFLSIISIRGISQSSLLSKKFQCDIKGSDSSNPAYLDLLLRGAANEGDDKCVQELIRLGAQINGEIRGWPETAPILLAAISNHPSVVRVLMEAGVSSKDKNAELALYLASSLGKNEAVKELVKYRVNPNMKGPGEASPLMAAAAQQHLSVVSTLIDSGADVNARSENGVTALMLSGDSPPIIRMLLNKGAQIDTVDKKGRTAIFYAVSDLGVEKLRALIEAGAKLNIVDLDGRSPLDVANEIKDQENKKKIISVLRNKLTR